MTRKFTIFYLHKIHFLYATIFVQDHSAISFTLQELTGLSAAGKVQNADVLIHQKILAGMCVFLHLRLLSSTILSAKQYTKKSAPSLQRDRPGADEGT